MSKQGSAPRRKRPTSVPPRKSTVPRKARTLPKAKAHSVRPPAPPARRRSRRTLYVGTLLLAVVIAAALVLASQLGRGGDGSTSAPTAAGVVGAQNAQRLLAGVPQTGTALGRPSAPVTLVEYADLQCPYCGVWSRDVFPTLVRDYVRTGKVRMEFRGLAFLGVDSDRALRAALAAGKQNRLWNFLDLVYANQGAENTGWVTDELLRGLAGAVRGLDVSRMMGDRTSSAVQRGIDRAGAQANAAGIHGTPAFEFGRTGEALQPLVYRSLDPAEFAAALDGQLGR